MTMFLIKNHAIVSTFIIYRIYKYRSNVVNVTDNLILMHLICKLFTNTALLH